MPVACSPAVAFGQAMAGAYMLAVHGRLDNGEPLTLNWKVTVAEGTSWWELRRVLQDTHAGAKVSEHYDIISRDKASWALWARSAGLDWAAGFRPSRRSSKSRQAHLDEPWAEHASVSTPCLLLLLVFWVFKKRSDDAERRCAQVLFAFLSRVLPIAAVPINVGHCVMLPSDGVASCAEFAPAVAPNGVPVCLCVKGYLQQRQNAVHSLESVSVQGFATMMPILALCAIGCAELQAWLRIVSQVASRTIDAEIPKVGDSNLLVAQGIVMQAKKRNRAADHDYRQALCVTAMQQKRAKSSGAMSMALGVPSSATIAGWDVRAVAEMQAAAMLTFSPLGPVCIAVDASRIGEPKEEVLFGGCWHEGSGRGAWLPPQVTGAVHNIPTGGPGVASQQPGETVEVVDSIEFQRRCFWGDWISTALSFVMIEFQRRRALSD